MSNAPAKNDSSLLATLVRTIRTDCLHRAVDQTMTSPSGKPLEWSFDLRPLLLDGSVLELIADSFWNRFEREAPFQVCGLELTAVPLLTAIIMAGNTRKRPVTGLIVRKERKPYGLVRKIEGTLTCRPIIVVDDLVNSGTSLEKVRAALGEVGRTISTVFTILDFRAARGIDWRERHNIAITSLFTLRDFGLSLATQAELVCSQHSNRSRERPGCFQLVGAVPEIAEISREIDDADDLWRADTSRQSNTVVQRETQSIPLRRARCLRGTHVRDSTETETTPFAERFPITMDLLSEIATQLSGRLERAMFVRLPPGARVYQHTDAGRYYQNRDRYHLVVIAPAGSALTCGGDSITPRVGEVWWLDNKQPHKSYNAGDRSRVHVIFDLLPLPISNEDFRRPVTPTIACS